MRLRTLIATIAALATAGASVLLTGGAASTTADLAGRDPLLGPNQVVMGDQVPWDRVGDGWYLTVIEQGPHSAEGWISPRHELLDLVNPRGGRYQMLKVAVRHGHGYMSLVDWSADRQVALLEVDSGQRTQKAVAFNLRTRSSVELRLPTSIAEVALRPDGDGLFATTFGDASPDSRKLLALDWSGERRVLTTGIGSNVLPSEDGTQLVTGPNTAHGRGLRVVDATTGDVAARVATPLSCDPYRWWAPGVVAARCWGPHQSLELWTVPLDGSAATQLSTYHGRRSQDLGDVDARELGGVTYLQASGPCGYYFLARQESDGSATTVKVPGAVGNVYLIDATDTALVIQHDVSCDGSGSGVRSVLSRFDPTGPTEHVMAKLPVDESFGRLLVYGERPVMGF